MLGTSLLWRSTVAFTYLKLKSAKCLCLLSVVLVLLLWFWSWSCKQWSWSCYFGLGLVSSGLGRYFVLGLKNLVLFISLVGSWKGLSKNQTLTDQSGMAQVTRPIFKFWDPPMKLCTSTFVHKQNVLSFICFKCKICTWSRRGIVDRFQK